MASRSIGTLSAFITADATQFMKEFNKLDRQIARSSKSFTEPGAKLALGFVGMENALKGVVKEIRFVIENVENIPGVNPQAVASIVTMRKNLADARNYLHGILADMIALGAQAVQSVGVGVASAFGYDDTSGLSKLETPDEIAKSKDDNFDQKIDEARKKLADARKAAALAAADEATQIKMLRDESQRYDTYAKSSSINTVQRLDAEREAFERTAQANAKFLALKTKLAELEQKNADTFKDVLVASSFKSYDEKLADVRRESNALRSQLFELKGKDQNDPAVLQAQVEIRQKLEASMRREIPLLEKQKQLAADVGNAFGSAFEDAILSANKFTDVLRNLAQELLRLFLRQSLINPLASGISGIFSGWFAPGGTTSAGTATVVPGKAVGGPVAGGSTYMVGEKGPELFVPDSSGRIIPNASLRGGAGSAPAMHFTYNFATGVTRQELAAIVPEIQRTTVSAVMDKVQRGGAYRKAFA